MFTTSTERDKAVLNEPCVSAPDVVENHENEFKKGVYKVSDGIFVAIGYSLANSICVETNTGLVIIDVLEDLPSARDVYKQFKKLCNNKPIQNIIFTHGHADHCQGILAFTEKESPKPTVYFHEDCISSWKSVTMFKAGTWPRAIRQFGTLLDHQLPHRKEKKWFKNAGIGKSLHSQAKCGDTSHDKITHQFASS